jgi:hypothetical protein
MHLEGRRIGCRTLRGERRDSGELARFEVEIRTGEDIAVGELDDVSAEIAACGRLTGRRIRQ